MNVKYALALTTIVSLLIAGGSNCAWAGFELTNGNTSTGPQTSASQPKQSYEVEKGIDESAPALKVFNEYYIPDAVRQKYGLSDSWSSGHSSPSGHKTPAENPVSLTPELSEAAPVADEHLVIMSQPKAVQTIASWRARKGENVRDILRRWSERERVDLMWASPNTPALQKDFSFFGKFQDAVNGLLKEAGGDSLHSQFRSEGLDPVMMAPASTVTTNLPVPQEQKADTAQATNILPQIFKPSPVKQRPETRWFGLSGAPLSEVLRVWAEDADIDLIWQAEGNYALKQSISQVGTFEDAVYKALSQYDNESVRPVGEIYLNQDTGRKVLVVRSDAS